MSIRRVIDLHYNRELGFRVSRDRKTSQNSSILELWRGENVLLRWHTYDEDGEPIEIEAGTTFVMGMDIDFSDGNTALAYSGPSEFVPSDWESAEEVLDGEGIVIEPAIKGFSLEEGRVCGRLNLNTDVLEAILEGRTDNFMYLIFWAFPPSLAGDAEKMGSLRVRVQNVPVNPDVASPVVITKQRTLIDWSTAGDTDIAVADPFALHWIALASNGDLTGLVYNLGTPADPTGIADQDPAFTDIAKYENLSKITGGIIRLTITTPATAPDVTGWAETFGTTWN